MIWQAWRKIKKLLGLKCTRKIKEIPSIETVALLFPNRPFFTQYNRSVASYYSTRVIMRVRYEDGRLVAEDRNPVSGEWKRVPDEFVWGITHDRRQNPRLWRFVKPVRIADD